MRLFGSSGIRGVFGSEITPELALRIGRAVGSMMRSVVVGWDPRMTSSVLVHAASAGMLAAGADLYSAGMVPTPTLARAARRFEAGLMVTASHNPPEFNGVKLWNPDGMAFDTAQMLEVERLIETGDFKNAEWNEVRGVEVLSGVVEEHIRAVVAGVGEVGCNIVVDCGNGAASVISPYLFREMGCSVTALNAHPDGRFPGRGSEPLEGRLEHLRQSVLALDAHLGIAHDGDGDRVVAFDEQGGFMDGDLLLPILAMHEDAETVVVPLDASMGIERVLRGKKVVRSRVGDVYVAEEMKRAGAEFGGEPSGTFIFAAQGYCPDGIYAAARLCEIAARTPLSELAARVPRYHLLRGRIPCPQERRERAMAAIEMQIPKLGPEEVSRMDGLRLDFGDAWCLLRPSGTEPKIKIYVEAEERRTAEKLYSEMRRLVEEAVR
ncbi:MAG: phosphoglucosamine mutase [Candidatus Thermoplasmatota archaeon]